MRRIQWTRSHTGDADRLPGGVGELTHFWFRLFAFVFPARKSDRHCRIPEEISRLPRCEDNRSIPVQWFNGRLPTHAMPIALCSRLGPVLWSTWNLLETKIQECDERLSELWVYGLFAVLESIRKHKMKNCIYLNLLILIIQNGNPLIVPDLFIWF